jgi:hypothetical protein
MMSFFKLLSTHSKTLIQLCVAVGLGSIFYGSIVFIGLLNNILPKVLTRDPAASLDAPFYVGFLSNTGALLWAAAVTLCFFGYFALSKFKPTSPYRSFLLISGLLTLVLLVDDFFLFHDDVLPNYLGLPQEAFFAFYGLSTLLFLLYFRKRILSSDFMPLLFAFLFLGLSMTVDTFIDFFPKLNFSGLYILEDMFKFLGIILWLMYFSRLTLSALFFPDTIAVPTAKHNKEKLAAS